MNINVYYKPAFVRSLNKSPKGLQEEIIEKIDLFKDTENHGILKVHKLKGSLKKFYSLLVDYKNRVVFEYLSDDEVGLLAIGDHEVYKLFL